MSNLGYLAIKNKRGISAMLVGLMVISLLLGVIPMTVHADGVEDPIGTFDFEHEDNATINIELEETETTPVVPLEGARFEVTNSDDTISKIVKTDVEGKISFKGLPFGKYTVLQLDTVEGYEKNAEYISVELTSENNVDTAKVYNKVKEVVVSEKIDITVTKDWEGTEASTIAIQLLANGEIIRTRALMGNNTSFTFEDMDVTDENGDVIEYSAQEARVDGQTLKVEGNAIDGFVITSTIIVPSAAIEPIAKTDINVEKVWKGKMKDEAVINLMLDDVKIDTVTLNKANNWKHTFESLNVTDAKGEVLEYTVNEEAIEGYIATVEGSVKDGFVITNTETTQALPILPIAKRSIDVEKVWVGEALEETTVNLILADEEIDTVVLNEANNWKHTFKDLSATDSEGKALDYKVSENKVKDYTVSVTGDMKEGFVITNTQIGNLIPLVPTATRTVSVEKVWVGEALEETTVKLFADGEYHSEVVLNEANGWKHIFEDLLVINNIEDESAIEYTIGEVEVKGYDVVIEGDMNEGFVITNTQKDIEEVEVPMVPLVEYMDVTIEMNWFGQALEEVEVELLADGESIDKTIILNEANNWKHTFKDLLVAENVTANDLIIYSIKEINLDGYTTEVIGNASEGFVINNTKDGYVAPVENENANGNETYNDNINNNNVADVQTYDGGVLPFAMLAMLAGAAFVFISKKKKSM